jgi:nicotinamide-nucleotide amidase
MTNNFCRFAVTLQATGLRMFNKDVLFSIGEQLKDKGLSVAVAESVTSGLLQCAFSNIPDASGFFQGGITAYNVGQKCRHLLVEPLHAIACDSVSEKTAQDLARNVCNLFTSNYGIGIVGYAARVPEKSVHSLYCFFAFAFEGKILQTTKITSDEEEGFATQLFYTDTVLQNFLSILEANAEERVKGTSAK